MAALLPLCEAFGSLDPSSISKTSDEFSIYMVFSAAFLFLLRLWKFYKPPLEVGGIGCDLPLEYLLLLHNSRAKSGLSSSTSQNKVDWNSSEADSASEKGLLIDHYPNLRAWYCQNINFVAGSLSGQCSDRHVHHVADKILDMMYRKMAKINSPSGNASSSNSGVDILPTSTMEEAYERPFFPAWDVLEAIPFVVEAILTACAYGRISSRDMTTGSFADGRRSSYFTSVLFLFLMVSNILLETFTSFRSDGPCRLLACNSCYYNYLFLSRSDSWCLETGPNEWH